MTQDFVYPPPLLTFGKWAESIGHPDAKQLLLEIAPLQPLQMNDNPPFIPTHLCIYGYYLNCFQPPEGNNLHFLNGPHSTAGFPHSENEE